MPTLLARIILFLLVPVRDNELKVPPPDKVTIGAALLIVISVGTEVTDDILTVLLIKLKAGHVLPVV
jgi:hypothetical protein